MTTPQEIKAWLEAGLPGASINVVGDGAHFEAIIVSELFVGNNTLSRHRMVYAALGDHMHSDIHALSMQTLTPEEQQAKE